MFAKHIISIVLLLFLIVFTNQDEAHRNIPSKILIAILVYAWFMMTTRCPFTIMIIVLIFLFAAYITSVSKSKIQNNDSLEEDEKKQKIKNAQFVQNAFAIASLVFSAIGFLVYLLEKQAEYGDNFSLIKFLTGDAMCRNSTNMRYL